MCGLRGGRAPGYGEPYQAAEFQAGLPGEGTLLTLCLLAVLGGATSLARITRFIAGCDAELLAAVGLRPGADLPAASTIGRLLARLDGDALDETTGGHLAWLAGHNEPGALVGIAVDGKPPRGSRTDGTAVHLLAAALHHDQAVLANARSKPRATRSPRSPRCSPHSTSPEKSSPPMPCTPSPTTPATSSQREPTACSSSRATSQACTTSSNTCPVTTSRSTTGPSDKGTDAARSAA